MRYYTFLIVFGLGVRCVHCFWPPAYKVDLSDRNVFVIASDEADYDEESEDEMIGVEDLAEFKSLAEDNEKFKPLHGHVEYYNKLAARTATEFADVFPNLFEPNLEDIHNLIEEAKPFIAGFKHELDEYDFDDLEERVFKAVRKKRNASDRFTFFKVSTVGMKPLSKSIKIYNEMKHSTSVMKKIILKNPEARFSPTERNIVRETRQVADEEKEESVDETNNEGGTTEMSKINDDESSNEEDYDYEQFRAEYYEQVESIKTDNKTFNYTDNGEPEETANDAIKKIVNFKMPKNCTQEELTQFGARALECLAHDYKNAKGGKNVRRVLSRTWLVVRIWLGIYFFIAIPCWCQKGWCCCCFNCAFCNPGETIQTAKKYYAQNPPGILEEEDENGKSKMTEFEPTLFELEAYEKFETAIRNL